jgi:hypothetical protein
VQSWTAILRPHLTNIMTEGQDLSIIMYLITFALQLNTVVWLHIYSQIGEFNLHDSVSLLCGHCLEQILLC